MTEEVFCPDEPATRALGRDLGRRLSPGDLVLVDGELGTGKTVFVRGLAEGLGIDPDEVASPTFAIVHEYGPPGRPPVLVHVDLYRLLGAPDEPRQVEELGLSDVRGGGAVLAVEWPGGVWVSEEAYRVSLRVAEGGGRRVRVSGPASSVRRR